MSSGCVLGAECLTDTPIFVWVSLLGVFLGEDLKYFGMIEVCL